MYYGKKYRLEETPIASGGEGTIFAIKGEPDKLAKVYHHPERAEQDKLRYMVLERQGVYGKFISRMIAWPLDVLIGDLGQIYGFTMPRFPGIKKLSEILPDHDIDWGERVVIAWNLCEIVQDVEKMNQCIGDMNPSNFGVDPESGHVYAFDADSFHFRASTGRLYPCYVGIAEYYAPELQRQITRGQDMRTLNPEHTFSRETDRFALAVLIFQLLFNGYHPFSARRLEQYGSSTVVHRQATNILNKVCAYFNPQVGTGIPKDAPPIDIVSPKMQQMFKRAFLTEDRPSATEWQGVLTELSGSLKTCSKQHHYYSGLSECPWCKGLVTRVDTTKKNATYNNSNRQPTNNSSSQSSAYGNNMNTVTWYEKTINSTNTVTGKGWTTAGSGGTRMTYNNYNSQSPGNSNGQPVGYGYSMNQPSNNHSSQYPGQGYDMNNIAWYEMDQRPAPIPTGGMIALSVVAILFFTIGGIVTLVKTMDINNAMTYAEQQARYGSAKKWGIASIVIGAVMTILLLIGNSVI